MFSLKHSSATGICYTIYSLTFPTCENYMDKDLANEKAKNPLLIILSPRTPCINGTELFQLSAAALVAGSDVNFPRNVAGIQKLYKNL